MSKELIGLGAAAAGLLLLGRRQAPDPNVELEPGGETWRVTGSLWHLRYGTRLYKGNDVPYYPGGGQVMAYRTEWTAAELVTQPAGIDVTVANIWRAKGDEWVGPSSMLVLVTHSSFQGVRGVPLIQQEGGGSVPGGNGIRQEPGGNGEEGGEGTVQTFASPVAFWTHKTSSGYIMAGFCPDVRWSRGSVTFGAGIVEVAATLPAGYKTAEPEVWSQGELSPSPSDFLSGVGGGFEIPLGLVRAGVLTSDVGRLLGFTPENAVRLETNLLEDQVSATLPRRSRILCRFPNSSKFRKRWEDTDDPSQRGWPVLMESLGWLFPDGSVVQSQG